MIPYKSATFQCVLSPFYHSIILLVNIIHCMHVHVLPLLFLLSSFFAAISTYNYQAQIT